MKSTYPTIQTSVLLNSMDAIIEKIAKEFDRNNYSVIELKTELPKNIFCILNPELISKFFIDKNIGTIKPKNLLPRESHLMQGALIADLGNEWKRKRSHMAAPFMPKNMKQFFNDLEPSCLSFFDRLTKESIKNETINICYEARRFTVDLSLKMFFSKSTEGPELNDLTDLVIYLEENMTNQTPLFLPTPGNSKFKRQSKRLRDFLKSIVVSRTNCSNPPDDFLTFLLSKEDKELKRIWNDEEIIDQMLAVFLGTSAVASPIFWTTYVLSAHPHVIAPIRQEFENVCSNKELCSLEDTKNLNKLDELIKETLRLYPAFWGNIRYSKNSCEILNYHFPKNSTFLLLRYFVNRHPSYWSSPQTFNPSRFCKSNDELIKSQYFIPFGSGPRTCLGAHMAPVIYKTVLSGLINRFDFSYKSTIPNDVPQISFQYGLYPKKDIYLKLTPKRSPLNHKIRPETNHMVIN